MKKVLSVIKSAVLVSVFSQVAVLSAAKAAQDQFEVREVVVHSSRNTLQVDLNEKTVLCSRADYSMPMLKVLIPGLSAVTLLNHQNFGAGAPCVTTGETCRAFARDTATAGPADILQGRNGVEAIDVAVTATRIETLDHVNKTCTVMLKEIVETNIRGKKLFHQREAELGERSYADCVR